jgi:chemotaxis protein histidine kinase CheA
VSVDDRFLGLFFEEATELLQTLETGLMDLEARQGDLDYVGRIFRAAHTLKGAAGMVGLRPIAEFTHSVEAVLDRFRSGSLPVTPEAITLLLRARDHLGASLEAAAEGREQPSAPAGLAEALTHLAAGRAPRPAVPAPPTMAARAPAPASQALPAASTVTIGVPEYLDVSAAEEVRKEYLAAVGHGCDEVKIDLRGTKDLDVQGLALLAALPRHAARQGRPRMRIAGASPEMETVLGVTGLAGSYGLTPGPTSEGA